MAAMADIGGDWRYAGVLWPWGSGDTTVTYRSYLGWTGVWVTRRWALTVCMSWQWREHSGAQPCSGTGRAVAVKRSSAWAPRVYRGDEMRERKSRDALVRASHDEPGGALMRSQWRKWPTAFTSARRAWLAGRWGRADQDEVVCE
jgi:hypothetical protein